MRPRCGTSAGDKGPVAAKLQAGRLPPRRGGQQASGL